MNREALLRAFAAVRAAIYAVGFVLLWGWLALAARAFDRRLPFGVARWLEPFGLAIGALGALLAVSCVLVFATRGQGTPAPLDAPRIFVASGPYRLVRNPMYLGGAGVIAGAGILLHSPSIILLAAGFLVFFHAFVLVYEEPALRERFGASYADYRQSVHRWLPAPTLRRVSIAVATLAAAYAIAAMLLAFSARIG